MQERDFEVYAEHSDSNKEMVSFGKTPYDGWNARVFNRTEVHPVGGSIRLEPETGVVSLGPGVYLKGTDHFSVGDSLATGATTLDPDFSGLYLNIPANYEKAADGTEYVGLWPIAGFTAKRRV